MPESTKNVQVSRKGVRRAERGRLLPHSSLTDFSYQPVSRLPIERRHDICIHTSQCQSAEPSFFLLAFGGGTRAPENTRHPSFASAPQSTGGPALISSLNILTLSQVHHKFMRVTLSTWSFWQEHRYICT